MALSIFSKNKESASASMPIEHMHMEEDFDSLESAMRELHAALDHGDYKNAATIFRSAFELMDSEPHVEGPHIG